MVSNQSQIEFLQTQEFFSNHAYNICLASSMTADQSMKHDAAVNKIRKLGYECVEAIAPESYDSGLFIYVAYSKERDLPVQVFCRGTKLDDASVVADLDPHGPGYSIMARSRACIMESLTNAIRNSKSSTTLNISGHSLGGSVSQLLLWFISVELKLGNLNFPQLSEINCSTFNSAPVNTKVASCLKRNLESKPIKTKVSFTAHQQKFDPANMSGTHILSDIDSKYAKVSVVRSSMGLMDYLLSFLELRPRPHSEPFYTNANSESTVDSLLFSEESMSKAKRDRMKCFTNDGVESGRDKVKKYLGTRWINLSKVVGVIFPWVKHITTPVYNFLSYVASILFSILSMSASILAVIFMPSPQTIGTLVVSVKELFLKVLNFIKDLYSGQIGSWSKKGYVNSSDSKYNPDIINDSTAIYHSSESVIVDTAKCSLL
ncbi:hypothetical protein MMH89_03415 [Candidatus Comchoanobacter bicostacola]|uniref:Fungal lipase-like domain-containing protein n=1 Tax=Candidatus Comchoanobacter bicostacola TaxID=2919598 RepID=A0ABY5DJV5_9GAMM|nr:hypothetical protein [Candidatus Comchoanobacter bicostacola]UTC24272.1 hypothetical protein MMH89_03415 [Candidatus Comchoanobacter bicostacola]